MATILNLSARMEAIVNMCDKCKTIADIGCDHGYITAELILQEKVNKVIATDISVKCLNKAILLCDSMNIANFISFREGNGFSVITKRDKVQQAVIAGMGGKEIIKILQERPKKLFNFVLQPQSDVVLLRQYLYNNGFEFVKDYLIKEDNRYYNIIKVKKAKRGTTLNNLEIYFGIDNFRENYQVFYEYLIERYLFLHQYKSKFGDLSQKNEEEWYFVNEALNLFGVKGEHILNSQTEQSENDNNESLEEENNGASQD